MNAATAAVIAAPAAPFAAPDFYAERLGEPFVSHRDLLRARLPRPLHGLVSRPGLLQGIALGWLARRGNGVAVIRRERGSLPALLVCALPPARRRVFVLELIRRPLPLTAWRRVLYRVWWHGIENPAIRRGMAAAQVMTEWERQEYADHYGIDRAGVHHVPWPLCEHPGGSPEAVDDGADAVFASGRTACDWETLFAAASGGGWSLTVVCSGRDQGRVRALAAGGGAEVHVEIPWAEHDRLLRAAAICAIPIEDRGLSAGHVRLMTAVEAGIPVVATEVRSLDGYLVPGETAVVVPAADSEAMRAAIEGLLADPDRRRRIRDAALVRARAWTYADYFARIATLILGDREIDPARSGSG
jgi:hypothetical protein